jgi:hypothetical protein
MLHELRNISQAPAKSQSPLGHREYNVCKTDTIPVFKTWKKRRNRHEGQIREIAKYK